MSVTLNSTRHYTLHTILTCIFLSYVLWKSVQGSSCPETRRADYRNTSRFYYCINLPSSTVGHVWVPAYCNFGLVFQPLLKMCVLPGEDICSSGIINAGNSKIDSFENKPVETPETAPDIATVLAMNLDNLENAHHQTLYSNDMNNGIFLHLSTRPPYVHNINNQILVSADFAYHKKTSEKPANAVTPPGNEIQYPDIQNGFTMNFNRPSTVPLHPPGNSLLNIPCTTGVRMPNLTDCTRYYLCNSTTGTIYPYNCPPRMAFNVHKRFCEVSSYTWCMEQGITNNQFIVTQIPETIPLITPNPCPNTGKTPDPESTRHYYICYYQGTKLVRQRVACPNSLHYCDSQKVCKKLSECFVY